MNKWNGKSVAGALVALALLTSGAMARDPAEGDVTPANASYLLLPAVPLVVTNGQAVTIAASSYLLKPSESATITLVAPTAAQDGLIVVLREGGAGTYHFTVADSGTCDLAGAFTSTGSNTVALTLMAMNGTWCEQKWSLTSATTLTVAGVSTLTGAVEMSGGATFDSTALIIANTTGILTMKGSATLDNNSSATDLNITETTITLTASGGVVASHDLTVTGGDITGAAGNSIDISEATDNAVTFVRHDTGTFTLTCKDDDTNADMTIVAGGTGDVTIGDLTDTSVTIPIRTVVTDADDRICTTADFGKIILLTHATTSTVTLPAAASSPAGAEITFILNGNDSLAAVFATAEGAETLIALGNATADSVTFGSGSRIGGAVKFISNGTTWMAFVVGGGTMTVTDA